MTAKIQSQTAIPPHKYSYLPIPTEAEMEEIIDLIYKHKDNPQLLQRMEEITPPHIMEALLNYSAKKTKEQKIRAEKAEQWAREVKAWNQEVENLTKEAKLLEESINERLGLQTMN